MQIESQKLREILRGFAVTDGEPYNEGNLSTGPDFGCINFQAGKS